MVTVTSARHSVNRLVQLTRSSKALTGSWDVQLAAENKLAPSVIRMAASSGSNCQLPKCGAFVGYLCTQQNPEYLRSTCT